MSSIFKDGFTYSLGVSRFINNLYSEYCHHIYYISSVRVLVFPGKPEMVFCIAKE